uniref:Pickpocket protein 28 n=2 Tax=Cacopsylla melanoneura TaxID=428564 RepID=A0A8D8XDD5_9HEMI
MYQNTILDMITLISFQLLLQNPVETPKLAAFGELISPGRESLIVIKPIINKSSPNIASSEPELRQCLFNKERTLRFYRHYTQRNCILECEANFTLSFCQCVMYFMPSK